MTDRETLARRFEAERPRLRAIATRLLGSAADADDAVQETWLRLARVEAAGIENLEAWLTTVVSRVSLDVLRSPRRTREYSWQVEPWRDEPAAAGADPAELLAQSEQVAVALLVMLETLSPAERIALVLHDVFGRPFDEIADVLGRSTDAARQLASRARRRVRGADSPPPPGRDRRRLIVDAWLIAVRSGDVRALLELLDDGAVLRADYGTAVQVLEGAQAISGQAALAGELAAHSTPVLIDGRPGVAAVIRGSVVSLMAFEIDHGRIIRLDVLADPKRLERIAANAAVASAGV